MKLEEERKVEREKYEKIYMLRGCEQMAWDCTEMCMHFSDTKMMKLKRAKLSRKWGIHWREKRYI